MHAAAPARRPLAPLAPRRRRRPLTRAASSPPQVAGLLHGNDGWSRNFWLRLEETLHMALAPPLCLHPSHTVARISNALQYNRLKLNAAPSLAAADAAGRSAAAPAPVPAPAAAAAAPPTGLSSSFSRCPCVRRALEARASSVPRSSLRAPPPRSLPQWTRRPRRRPAAAALPPPPAGGGRGRGRGVKRGRPPAKGSAAQPKQNGRVAHAPPPAEVSLPPLVQNGAMPDGSGGDGVAGAPEAAKRSLLQYEEVDEGTKLRRLALSANTLAALHAHQRMLDTSMLSDLSAPKSQQSSVASLAAAAAALRHARGPPAPPPPRSPPSPRTLAAAAAAGHQSGEKKKMDRDPSISQQLQVARPHRRLRPRAPPRRPRPPPAPRLHPRRFSSTLAAPGRSRASRSPRSPARAPQPAAAARALTPPTPAAAAQHMTGDEEHGTSRFRLTWTSDRKDEGSEAEGADRFLTFTISGERRREAFLAQWDALAKKEHRSATAAANLSATQPSFAAAEKAERLTQSADALLWGPSFTAANANASAAVAVKQQQQQAQQRGPPQMGRQTSADRRSPAALPYPSSSGYAAGGAGGRQLPAGGPLPMPGALSVFGAVPSAIDGQSPSRGPTWRPPALAPQRSPAQLTEPALTLNPSSDSFYILGIPSRRKIGPRLDETNASSLPDRGAGRHGRATPSRPPLRIRHPLIPRRLELGGHPGRRPRAAGGIVRRCSRCRARAATSSPSI